MDSNSRRRAGGTGPSRGGAGSRGGRALRSGRPVVNRRTADGATPADDLKDVAPSRAASTRPAGTRPATHSGGLGRRIGRISAGSGAAAGTGPASRTRSQLAKQVAVLGLVFCAVALVLAVPLRHYLAQRAALGVEVSHEQQLRAEFASLVQEQAALTEPAYIQAEAKRRLQYVRPGDTVYVVHAPPLAAAKAAPAKVAAPDVPWYSSLWDTLSDPVVTASPSNPATGSAPVTPTSSSTASSSVAPPAPSAPVTPPTSKASR
ncbi:cell division protein FtsB [Nakamurella sp. UYEF19]|uniref:FtsB family cell division protein n=1 Tax=Nakamurella sp. UYEF19 TaxID=1756392 RepID=UPI0033989C3C